MKLYHRTWAEYADNILERGFIEGVVQVSDRPLESTEIKSGGGGDVSLCIEIALETIAPFEDKNTHYKNLGVRVFTVSATVVNANPIEFFESNYVGMTRQELLAALANNRGATRQLPHAPYTQNVVLERALTFLEKVQGNDEQRRRRLISECAYSDWESDPNQMYWGDDQRYWYAAETKVDRFIKDNGGVPYR